MTAPRFTSPYFQPVDATGTPYAGGQLFFYASGTTNLQGTFSDVNLTVQNPNPVIADSSGTFPSIFMQPLAYKAVLQDALGNQIWTADPWQSP